VSKTAKALDQAVIA